MTDTSATLIVQDNAITKSKQNFSALEKNLFYMLISQLDEKKRYYFISVDEIKVKTGIDNPYYNYKIASRGLMDKIIDIKKEDSKSGNAMSIVLCPSAEYMEEEGLIQLEISDKLKPYLFDLKNNFTTFQLDMALSMKSKYSKRIYEMLSQYKNTSYFIITVEDLKHRLDLSDSYPNFGDLKIRVVNPAIKEINKYSDIKASYELKKKGRKIHSILFKIEYMPHQKKIDFQDENKQLFDRLVNKFNLSKTQAQKVLKAHDKKHINKKLFEINGMEQANKITSSLGGYTARIFSV